MVDLAIALIEYCQQHNLLSTNTHELASQLREIGANHGVTYEDILQVL